MSFEHIFCFLFSHLKFLPCFFYILYQIKGKYENGKVKQIIKYIGYFSTESEAMKSLVEYNANPYDINNENIYSKGYRKTEK